MARFGDEQGDDQLRAEEEGQGLESEEAGAGEGVGVEYLWAEIVLMTAFQGAGDENISGWRLTSMAWCLQVFLCESEVFVLWQDLMGFLLRRAF